MPVEKIVEKVVEVEKVLPVEKIVEVEKVVVVEKIVDKVIKQDKCKICGSFVDDPKGEGGNSAPSAMMTNVDR